MPNLDETDIYDRFTPSETVLNADRDYLHEVSMGHWFTPFEDEIEEAEWDV